MTINNKITSPWKWVPTTFFMQGFPGVMMMVATSIMYKNLGLSNEQITIYTGMLTLPWVIKPLWASFIDIFKTKSWWISMMEMLLGGGFVGIAFSLQSHNYFFPLSLAFCWVTAFLSSTHDIASDGYYLVELHPDQQAFFLGFQTAAYQVGKIMAQGVLVMATGYLFAATHDYFHAWSVVLVIAGAICFCVGLYHRFILPRDAGITFKPSVVTIWKEFLLVYREFFLLNRVWFAIAFLLLFRCGEQLVASIIPLFLLDKVGAGGLDLGNQFTGFAYGTCAPIAILLGGLLGGYAIYQKGFKFWIWPMLLIINIPHLMYVVLAFEQIRTPLAVLTMIVIEQFCFSFGFAAYLMFLMHSVKDSKYKTAHYSFFSGVMLLGLMIPKMLSGWLQEHLGYPGFFILVFLMIIPAAFLIPHIGIDASYGKKK